MLFTSYTKIHKSLTFEFVNYIYYFNCLAGQMLTLIGSEKAMNHNTNTGLGTPTWPVHHEEIADEKLLINQFILSAEQSKNLSHLF